MYNNAQAAPPVNNLLQPDIYNRLDAEAIEKTRVVNTQLEERLRAQQKILAKYKLAAERYHRREKNLVQNELNRISNKLPAVSRVKDFRNKFLYGEGLHKTLSSSVPDLRPTRKIRGVPEERPDHPFCARYFLHHLPNKKKYYKIRTPSPPPVVNRTEEGEATAVGGGDGGVAVPSLTVSEVVTTQITDLTGNGVTGSQMTVETPRREDVSLSVNGYSSLPEISDTLSPSKSDPGSVDLLHVTNDNYKLRHSGKDRQSHRKSPRREIRRMTLPPIQEPSLKLSLSSPQLFQG